MSVTSNPAATTSDLTLTQVLKATETTTDFIDSVGVNMHSGMASADIPYAYRDTALVESDLQYLQISHIRDGLGAGFSKSGYDYTTTTEKYLASKGYKFDFPISTLAAYEKTALDNFAAMYPGALESVEGPNEANNLTVDQVNAFQKSLFDLVHGDPLLKNVSVMDFTLAYAQPTYFQAYGNLDAVTDKGNVHIYGTYGRSPSSFSTWLSVAQAATPSHQMNVTETGYSTLPSNSQWGVDETTQAKYILDTLMDAAENGVGITYLYELLDRNTADGAASVQGHYGLFRADGTPKPAAVAIHNLMSILGSEATAPAELGNLSVALKQPLASGVNSIVIQKNDTTFDYVLWAEPNIWDSTKHQAIAAPTISVDLSFPGATAAAVYDPLVGTSPVYVFGDPQIASVVNVTDHPVIIEVTVSGNYVDPLTGVLTARVSSLPALETQNITTMTVRDTAANLVGTLDILGSKANVKSIIVSDNMPLALTYDQFKADTAGLNKIASYSLNISGVQLSALSIEKNARVMAVGISDTASKLSGAQIGLLGADAKVQSITVSDGNPLTLTGVQYASDSAAFAKMSGNYTIAVNAASVANMAALDADQHVSSLIVRDVASALGGAELGVLGANSKVKSIIVSDGKPLALSYAQYQAGNGAFAKISGAYSVAVSGSSVDRVTTLEQNSHISAISVSDTAASISSALDRLSKDAAVKSISVSDGKPLALTYSQFKANTAGLNKIANYNLTLSGVQVNNLSVDKNAHITAIAVSDTAAKLGGNELNVLGADSKVISIAASDANAIALTYAQYQAATAGIGKLTSATGLLVTGVTAAGIAAIERDTHVKNFTVRDSATAIAAAFTDLQAHASAVTSVVFTGKANPTLSLSAEQVGASTSVLSKITSPYVLKILGTGNLTSKAFDPGVQGGSALLYSDRVNNDGSNSYHVLGKGISLSAGHNDTFDLLGNNDTVLFGASGFGSVAISDFSAGDVINFSKSVLADYSTLSAHVSGTSSAVITDSKGDIVTLMGVGPASLTASMFKFS